MSEPTEPTGYDPAFLGTDAPPPVATGVEPVVLPSTHFTIAMHPTRRLALWTGVNIDGARLVEVARSGDEWYLDPRLPADAQAGPELYSRNDLDRGHLVRRRDPGWGERAVAERANRETFAYTNAAPQAAAFNQSERLWLGLEDYVLGAADVADAKLSVFTGPVLADDDEEYRGVLVPRRFWKVAAWASAERGGLAATAYLLDQSPQLDDLGDETVIVVDEPRLGPYRTFQVAVTEIERATGLGFGPLADADRYVGVQGVVPSRQELTSTDDITL
jgi:endonuclease G, mitochondrial